ncbi:MAG: globin [Armatimonadetes bacterium]|nr:globin [Armatimonadota bacterium]MDE2205942.1 globin [Armatimonadota bacterium]
MTATGAVYQGVGGIDTFRRLTSAFYRRIEQEPLLRPMYPDELAPAAERLALFLAQFFGGPRLYSEQRGAPRLRMRHMAFDIGQRERDAWVRAMSASVDEIAIPEPWRSAMLRYFEDTATFLVRRSSTPGSDPRY